MYSAFSWRIADEYAERNKEVMKLGTEYIMNPINAFKLIKRLTHDLDLVESVMTKNSADYFLRNITARRATNQVIRAITEFKIYCNL